VRQHQRVVVHVHDPGLRCDPLRDLMRVVGRREPGPHVEELPDPGLAGQVAHDPAEEGPVGPRDIDDPRVDGAELVASGPVDRVVVLAPEPVIPDPGRMRNRDIHTRASGILGHATLLDHRRITL
jgi:hypothetical protein